MNFFFFQRMCDGEVWFKQVGSEGEASRDHFHLIMRHFQRNMNKLMIENNLVHLLAVEILLIDNCVQIVLVNHKISSFHSRLFSSLKNNSECSLQT